MAPKSTLGFETTNDVNAKRMHNQYLQHNYDLSSMCLCVRISNLSINSLGIFGNSCKSFIEM